jgi:hypothetical protein
VRRLTALVVALTIALVACSSSKRGANTGAVCGDHHHRAQAARLLSQSHINPLAAAAYLKTCGSYSVGCKSASSQGLDAAGKPTGPMVTAAPPECDYTRELAGRTEKATLVKIGDQCWLRAHDMPEIPAPCVPKEAG